MKKKSSWRKNKGAPPQTVHSKTLEPRPVEPCPVEMKGSEQMEENKPISNPSSQKTNTESNAGTPPQKRNTLIKHVLRYFISGTIVVLPLVVTVGIVIWLANFLIQWLGPDTMFGKLLSYLGINFVPNGTTAYIFGWLFVLAFLFLIGFLVDVVIRKEVVTFTDRIIGKIPLVGSIYGTTRKFTDIVGKHDKGKMDNMSPVYCRFGTENGGTLVLALLPNNEIHEIDGHQYQVVVVPTAPVPFGGGMFFMPVENIFPAEMSIDKLMNFYITMGVSSK